MKRFHCWQFALLALLLGSTFAWGGDTTMLRPPKGSTVAIIVFEDLECPTCARAAPMLQDAAKAYNVPLVQYDFPLRQHAWSFEGAVNARYFDTKSKKLGDEYRLYIFKNQRDITRQNLRGFTERFAEQNKVALPSSVDPSGELATKVEQDRKLGERIPLDHTPTIYIVRDAAPYPPFMEVLDLTKLRPMMDQVMKESPPAPQAHKTTSSQKGSRNQ